MSKRLALAVLAVLNLAVTTGCGRRPGVLPAAREAAGGWRGASTAPALRVGGRPRKLGFDLVRARGQQQVARPVQLPPIQGVMPRRVDLRAQCSPIYDQGDLGSCTAFAVGKGAREYLQRRRAERPTELSALYLYYETRRLRNAVNLDSGATITDTMKAIAQAGIASEATWPYLIDVFTQRPADAAYAQASTWRLTTGVQLAGLPDIKKALARKQPVVFGMRLYQTFRDVGPDGLLPLPQPGDVMVGGHAVAAVGYDDGRQVLIVRNSFGTAWGDQGHFYLPYAYVTPDLVMDVWTAR
ncbi:MAG: C1 family peptidase [Candidatus Sericytochromatia bacterium]|nr:C1 family peptidase [Candidatus Sericytochromatia bacterium]